MTDYKVIIPEEHYSILNFEDEGLPGVAVVNTALRDFEGKIVFDWNLSLIIELEDIIENGMPSKKEVEIVDSFGDKLDNIIKGPDKEKPNALFLARITWNKTRRLIWRVFDPEIADTILQGIISKGDSPREFDYQMEQDTEWNFTKWYLTEWGESKD